MRSFTSPARRTAHLPFRMRTVFQDCLLITYAVDLETLAALLPPTIYPFERNGEGFISIVVANMRGMRPALLPVEAMGVHSYQIVYRVVVRLRTCDGIERPGVFFLRSDCNDPILSRVGNRLTEFKFHFFRSSAINLYRSGNNLLAGVETRDAAGDLVLHLRDDGPIESTPPADPFTSVEEEKQRLVQLFNAFAHDNEKGVVHDMGIERGDWQCHRLTLMDGFSAFFQEGPFDAATARPVSHLYIRECAYVWKPTIAIPLASLRTRD